VTLATGADFGHTYNRNKWQQKNNNKCWPKSSVAKVTSVALANVYYLALLPLVSAVGVAKVTPSGPSHPT
jgi:hypothetical protein